MGHGWFIKIKGIDARWNCLANGAYVSFFACFFYAFFLSLLLYTFNASQYKVLFKPVKGPCLATEVTCLHFICLCVCGLFFLFLMHVFLGAPCCERVPCCVKMYFLFKDRSRAATEFSVGVSLL